MSFLFNQATSVIWYLFSLRVCDDIMVDRILILVAGYIGTGIIDWESYNNKFNYLVNSATKRISKTLTSRE
jgi:hypothetical protein